MANNEPTLRKNRRDTWRDAVEKLVAFGNALLALEQCVRRNLQPGPFNIYHGWLHADIQANATDRRNRGRNNKTTDTQRLSLPRLLVCPRTNRGRRNLRCAPIPGFDLDTSLRALTMTRTAFAEINGNVQGVARQREIAISAAPHDSGRTADLSLYTDSTGIENFRDASPVPSDFPLEVNVPQYQYRK